MHRSMDLFLLFGQNFVKIGNSHNMEQWREEARSLRHMGAAARGLSPMLHALGL
jgi:hypothetical protein